MACIPDIWKVKKPQTCWSRSIWHLNMARVACPRQTALLKGCSSSLDGCFAETPDLLEDGWGNDWKGLPSQEEKRLVIPRELNNLWNLHHTGPQSLLNFMPAANTHSLRSTEDKSPWQMFPLVPDKCTVCHSCISWSGKQGKHVVAVYFLFPFDRAAYFTAMNYHLKHKHYRDDTSQLLVYSEFSVRTPRIVDVHHTRWSPDHGECVTGFAVLMCQLNFATF